VPLKFALSKLGTVRSAAARQFNPLTAECGCTFLFVFFLFSARAKVEEGRKDGGLTTMPIPQEINLNKEFEGLRIEEELEARKEGEEQNIPLSLCTFLFLHYQHHGLRGKKEDKVAKGSWMCVFITSATAK